MIFAQSSYNYQTRSSNHRHPVQPASCIPFAVRSSAVRMYTYTNNHIVSFVIVDCTILAAIFAFSHTLGHTGYTTGVPMGSHL